MRYLWMPRLVERIQAAAASTATATTASPAFSAGANTTVTANNNTTYNNFEVHSGNMMLAPTIMSNNNNFGGSHVTQSYTTPENSSNGTASSDSFGTQVSPVSDLTHQDYYNNVPVGTGSNNNVPNPDYYYQQAHQLGFSDCITSPSGMFPTQEMEMDYFNSMDPNTPWIQSGDTTDNFWNVDNMLLFQQLNM